MFDMNRGYHLSRAGYCTTELRRWSLKQEILIGLQLRMMSQKPDLKNLVIVQAVPQKT